MELCEGVDLEMSTSKPTLPSFEKLPKTYEALCRLHMPRTLHDEIELDAITEIIDLMAGHALTADQSDYLETLAELSAAYESAHYDAPPSQPPHEFLAAHLQNIGMTATEWGKLIGIDRSTASRLLSGERKFNTAHIRNTAKALGLEASHLI
jgi:HTH-type transcriptional regulator / antitoxin HigA